MQLPSHMKCMVYGIDLPRLQIRPTPKARTGHVLVRVEAVGLNPVDAKDVIGDKLPATWTYTRSWIRSNIISNKIPGFDLAGTCVEDADQQNGEIKQFSNGDKVFGTMPPLQGSLAEYVSVPIDQLAIMPSNLTFEEAAALPLVCLTAFQAFSPHVSTKSSVLVIGGSGGTGHVALQIARCLGAHQITAICSQKNSDFCRSCGAAEVIDYSKGEESLVTNLIQSAHTPFNVVLDCVSSADPRDMTMNYPSLLRQHSRANHLLAEDYIYRRLGGPTRDWIRAGLERTIGIRWWPDRHDKLFWVRFPNSAEELQRVREWVEDGKLRPTIAATYAFSEDSVKKAFDDLISRRVQGKCVVSMGVQDTANN